MKNSNFSLFSFNRAICSRTLIARSLRVHMELHCLMFNFLAELLLFLESSYLTFSYFNGCLMWLIIALLSFEVGWIDGWIWHLKYPRKIDGLCKIINFVTGGAIGVVLVLICVCYLLDVIEGLRIGDIYINTSEQ